MSHQNFLRRGYSKYPCFELEVHWECLLFSLFCACSFYAVMLFPWTGTGIISFSIQLVKILPSCKTYLKCHFCWKVSFELSQLSVIFLCISVAFNPFSSVQSFGNETTSGAKVQGVGCLNLLHKWVCPLVKGPEDIFFTSTTVLLELT